MSDDIRKGFVHEVLLNQPSAAGGDGHENFDQDVSRLGEVKQRVALPRATSPIPFEGPTPEEFELFFNRELSWLDFNWRVLFQALDPRLPLLERVKFIAITASNLDEFVRKRVGGLKRQIGAEVLTRSPDGRTPREQLELIRQAMHVMHKTMTRAWEERLKPQLADEDVLHIRDFSDITPEEQESLHAYFTDHIFPILTPLAVDPGHPFPFISNQSLSLAIELQNPAQQTSHFARIKVPLGKGRWVPVEGSNSFVPVEQVIAEFVSDLFRGMDVIGVHAFRTTRNADVGRDEEEADDLIELISEELRERRFASVVRLELQKGTPETVKNLLQHELGLDAEDIFEVDGMIDLTGCMMLSHLDYPDHQFRQWTPVTPTRLYSRSNAQANDIFSVIRDHDLLVHHPFESFHASVQRFIDEAAHDASVVAIKQTLYRTSEESPIVAALMRAAEMGKQVAVLVEVKARFDEQNNIEWGRMLENAGVHVTYGLVGLKTHCKTTLVIREEADGLRSYCHIGTGNYNATTARLYTDVGLFTARRDVGYDLVHLFHYLTGFAPAQTYRTLIVAPKFMRAEFVRRIRAEVDAVRQGKEGRIVAKMNALDDVEIIKELYRASQAGVKISLIVRGHCRLRPGLPGLSDNIKVISILGRFLEHSRVYYFDNDGDPAVYIGSGDWQRRNLEDRVEAALQVEDPVAKAKLIDLLEMALSDRKEAWELGPDGRYIQRIPSTKGEEVGLQGMLMNAAEKGQLNDDAINTASRRITQW